jgi:3-mercaptopyruvate sulfurtransferase SseA
VDEIRAIYQGAGVDLSKPMVFYCGAGVMATLGKHAADLAGSTGEK